MIYVRSCRIKVRLIRLVVNGREPSDPSSAHLVALSVLFNMFGSSPDTLFVVPCHGSCQVIIFPFTGRNSSLHHKATISSVLALCTGDENDSLDLFECPALCLWDVKVDKRDREEPSESVDETNHGSQPRLVPLEEVRQRKRDSPS